MVAKVTLEEFPPMSLAFLRFGLACLFLAPYVAVRVKKVKIESSDLPKLAAVGIFIITLNITFFFEGISKTSAINASALSLIIPIFSVLISWLFLKEKIYLINLGGAVLGLLGALIIIGIPQIINGSYSPIGLMGNVLIVIASISFVIGALLSEKLLKKYSTLTVTAVAFLVGTITFSIPALREYLQNPTWMQSVTLIGVLGLMYMTLLSSISAYFLFEWGLSKTDIVKADLFQYIQPFIAAILAVTLLGERASTSFLIGAVLVAAGVYLGTLAKGVHHMHKIHRT